MRTMIFVDSRNMFSAICKKFGNKARLDYSKVKTNERAVVTGLIISDNDDSGKFVSFLRMKDFEVNLILTLNLDTEDKILLQNAEGTLLMISEVSRYIDRLDKVIIYSTDKNLTHYVDTIRSKGIFVEIRGASIPKELRSASSFWVELKQEDLINAATDLYQQPVLLHNESGNNPEQESQ